MSGPQPSPASGNDPLPVPQPQVDPDNEPFWAATARGVLLLPRCTGCGTVVWYPRFFCPACGGTQLTWFEASGKGVVYTFTVVRKSRREGYTTAVPYVVASVELAEGPRIFTNIVGCSPEAVRIGMPVEVTFVPTADGTALYRFRPAG
ncbi:Zn-ribbon domain-containing OB-fold protein [Dactylosporangium sp. CA-092794]|uniref:Zn-ribbon domain-containing OB-fold protein n=1 Tax=Dactylosporangium sp. CA-092794 TaxID=3239929 RepID=UPI003D8F4AB3